MEHPVHSFINNTLAQTVTTDISLASKQMKIICCYSQGK